MPSLYSDLVDIEKNLLENKKISPLAFEKFKKISGFILSVIPAKDIEAKIAFFINEFNQGKINYNEFLNFIIQIKAIIYHLTTQSPLGISQQSDAYRIKALIMNALNEAIIVFKKRFGIDLPPIQDTRIFVAGSRCRGYSFDGGHSFAPGRDADILIIGEGIFAAEVVYIERIDAAFAEKCRKLGFIPGDDRRFIPPVLKRREIVGEVAAIFMHGDKKAFKLKDDVFVKVNFHIASPKSAKIKNEARIEIN